jgi:SOS-response transcriptional repressor LexA
MANKPQPWRHSPFEKKILDFIVKYKKSHDGNSPTNREIASDCGLFSTSTVNYFLHKLQEDGWITWPKDLSCRSIIVTGGKWMLRNESWKAIEVASKTEIVNAKKSVAAKKNRRKGTTGYILMPLKNPSEEQRIDAVVARAKELEAGGPKDDPFYIKNSKFTRHATKVG